MNSPHERYRRYLENLSPERLSELSSFVTEDVRFRDPFNDVQGIEAMRRVLMHMYENIQDVRFEVREVVSEGSVCLMSWRFDGCLRGRPWGFEGTSVVRFADDGRVVEHIDHWNSGRDLYEHLPVIGWLLAFLRRRLSVD